MRELSEGNNLNFVEIIDILNGKPPPPTTCTSVQFETADFPLPQ